MAMTLLGALALPRSVEAGGCARVGLDVLLLTPRSVRVPRGEGLLVGLGRDESRTLGPVHGTGYETSERDVPPVSATLERADHASIALRSEALGAGLWRLVPERAPEAGAWTLRAGEHTHAVRFVDGAAPARLGAPRVRAITASSGIAQAVIAELSSAPPAAARAVVASMQRRDTWMPRMSAQLSARDRSLVLFQRASGRCAPPPIGSPTPPHAVVRLSWVDALGRTSPPSEVVTVTARDTP